MARRVRKSTRGRRNQSGGGGQGWKTLQDKLPAATAAVSQTTAPKNARFLEQSEKRAKSLKQEAGKIRGNYDSHAPPAAVKKHSNHGLRAVSNAQEQKAMDLRFKQPAREKAKWNSIFDAQMKALEKAPRGLSVSPNLMKQGYTGVEEGSHKSLKSMKGAGRRRTKGRRTKGRRTKGRRTKGRGTKGRRTKGRRTKGRRTQRRRRR